MFKRINYIIYCILIVGIIFFFQSSENTTNDDSINFTKHEIGLITIMILVSAIIISLIFNSLLKKKESFSLQVKESNKISDSLVDEADVQIHSKNYDDVTILFADIQGFSKITEFTDPERLINGLDQIFSYFDKIIETYNVEKIKTIGDAYMCVGGIPNTSSANAVEVIMTALDMQNFMKNEQSYVHEDDSCWDLRIGIHTGSVISGMIGQKKITFDIWGSAVNIASRMESSSKAGKVNISQTTYDRVKDFFVCEYRGKVPIKFNSNGIDMYFVNSILPELSEKGEGLKPNNLFYTKTQLLYFNDLYNYVIDKLSKNLLPTLYYHNKAHTEDVVKRAEQIGEGENVTLEDILLLKTATLLHDTGFMIEYINHEENSIFFAKDLLPKFGYSKSQINRVISLIKATHVKHSPKNHLERIIKDADLDYLGRSDFITRSQNLFQELNANNQNKKMSLKAWNKTQYEFIQKHTYYTETAKELREVQKVKQMKKIRDILRRQR